MVLIYNNYLPLRWSISLSSLGILGFGSAPFRDFLFRLLTGEGWRDLGVNLFPDIVNFPFPSLSLLLFLTVFYLSIKRIRMSRKRMLLLSIFWALQSQIHIVNAIIGIPFWVALLGLTLWKSNRGHWTSVQTRQFLLQIVLIALICLPTFYAIWSQVSSEDGLTFVTGGMSDVGIMNIDWFFIFTYFVVPILALISTYKIFRIDPYEVVLKFLPVAIIMIIELTLVLLWWIFGIGIPSDLLLSRMGLFFLHILYYVPSIYCVHRAVFNFQSPESGFFKFLIKTRLVLSRFFKNLSSFYLPIFAVLLTIFSLSSSIKAFDFFENFIIPNHENSNRVSKLMIARPIGQGVLIGPDNLTNISLMSKVDYETLWSNRVIGKISLNEATERFALYAKVVGWTEKEFVLFMTPSESLFKYSSKKISLTSSKSIPGLGYWLTLHNKVMGDSDVKKLTSKLIKIYQKTDIEKGIIRHNVVRIVVNNNSEYAKNNKGVLSSGYEIFNFNNSIERR
jgi:hypothetical protein